MQLVRSFWQAAIVLDPAAAALDQSRQFPICQPAPLTALFRRAGLSAVTVEAIGIPTTFHDFDDYWRPHLRRGSAVAQRYVTSLGETERAALRERLQATLPIAADGSIPLIARAWAVRGTKESQQVGASWQTSSRHLSEGWVRSVAHSDAVSGRRRVLGVAPVPASPAYARHRRPRERR
jgi:hypothetical protein